MFEFYSICFIAANQTLNKRSYTELSENHRIGYNERITTFYRSINRNIDKRLLFSTSISLAKAGFQYEGRKTILIYLKIRNLC